MHYLFFWLLILLHPLYCEDIQGIKIDLREPIYESGILTTDKGGVISGPKLRIQALKIQYSRPNSTIEAEGAVIFEYGEYIFVGDKLFYNLETKEGTLYDGRTRNGPWFFGGKKIELKSDLSYLIQDAYITTSENLDPDWMIFSSELKVMNNKLLEAEKVQLKLFDYHLFTIPTIKLNLDSIFDSPIRYRFKAGGKQGPRFGLTYEMFSWEHWKTFVRFDYSITRGPGGGLETFYHSEDGKTEFHSINYLARDNSLFQPHEKARYRFEGRFFKQMDHDKLTFLLSYDKVSDIEMPTNYYDNDFNLAPTERTQLLIRRQEDDWIANFYTRVRINSFQTVKEELPSFGVNLRPFTIGKTGIIFENWSKASFLDFKYAKFIPCVRDYESTRFEYKPSLYRPFTTGPFTFTPELGAVAILYGDSPEKEAQFMGLGIMGVEMRTQFFRRWNSFKHIVEPYSSYYYYSYPTVSPNKHYIFDINDGWYHLNMITLGVRNSFIFKEKNDSIVRPIYLDVFTYAFPNTPHINALVPRIYSKLIFFTIPTLRHTVDVAWDFWHNQLAHVNIRLDWTMNIDFAISTEYRHRNAFDWRKSNYESFFLDAFRSEESLEHSSLSDRRDTVLLRAFYRFHPNWALDISSRHGWNRRFEPSYLEYEIDLLTTIQTAWNFRFSFQHFENDNRFAIYVNVGFPNPKLSRPQIGYFE